MPQNKYDDPEFFTAYSAMPRSVGGLDEAGEWPAFRAMLPDLRGKRVLDLGCGFGWHCRYARQHGARSVVGIDLSEKMLARAAAATDDPAIEYRRGAIEDIAFENGAFDVVISSLALHYVERFDLACRRIGDCLVPGGDLVLSVEHPIFTVRAAQAWHRDAAGQLLHWPVDDYQHEGRRHTRWLADGVVKYHRTLATYVNTLVDTGFRLVRLVEPEPSAELQAARPEMRDESRRPMFLLLAAVKEPAPPLSDAET
jgi:SAM-dependent methyltransferase